MDDQAPTHLALSKLVDRRLRVRLEKDHELARYEAIHQELRNEIRQRIEQRDRYSIQMTVSLAAIVAISATRTDQMRDMHRVLLAAPLVSIYYTVLIQYSYAVHSVLSRQLREAIEPAIARLTGVPVEFEIENYYKTHRAPGIRRTFFMTSMWVMTVCTTLVIGLTESSWTMDSILVLSASLLYWVFALGVTLLFPRSS